MATDPRSGMTILDETACWTLLSQADVVRLAVFVDGDVEVFPVNAVVDDRTLVFATGEGTKLAASVVAGRVTVEADGYDRSFGEAWSVVLKGEPERLERFSDIQRAEDLPLVPWSAHPKQWFVRVHPLQVTGRRFVAVRPPAHG